MYFTIRKGDHILSVGLHPDICFSFQDLTLLTILRFKNMEVLKLILKLNVHSGGGHVLQQQQQQQSSKSENRNLFRGRVLLLCFEAEAARESDSRWIPAKVIRCNTQSWRG